MAGNTRGRLKERVESIHRDFEWAKTHTAASLELIGDMKPELSKAFSGLGEGIEQLDKLAMSIYSHL